MSSHSKHHHRRFFHPHWHLVDSTALYVTHTIRTFAVSLIGIFLPIYIWQLPDKVVLHPDPIISNFTWILLYFLVRSLSVFVFTFIIGNIIFTKIHLKRAIFLSMILLALELWLWLMIGNRIDGSGGWSWVIILAGIVAGLKVLTYWVPYHILFVRKANGSKRHIHYGSKTSLRFVLARIAGAAGPVLGGVIITQWGFSWLFGVGIGLILVSAIPILVGVIEHHHHKHNIGRVFNTYAFSAKFLRTTIAFAGDGVDQLIYTVFWPILLFLALENFVKLGTITTFSLTISIITVLWVGRAIDKRGPKLMHSIGVFFNTLFYIPRMFVMGVPFLYAIEIADRFNSALYSVPYLALTYEKASKDHDADFIIYRELVVNLATVVVAGITILILPILPRWQLVFLIAALGSSLTWLINYRKRKSVKNPS